MKNTMKKLAIVACVAVIGAAPLAFAHDSDGVGGYDGYGGHMMGRDYGGHMMDYGYGGQMMMGSGNGYQMMRPGYDGHRDRRHNRENLGLSQQQTEQLAELRASFYRENRDLQNSIYEKSTAIERELAKQNPDSARLSELQASLSQLEGQLDQKRLDYQLTVRKIVPDAANRVADSYGMGGNGRQR